MNKTIKIIATLLLAMLLVTTLSQVCFAKDIITSMEKEIQTKGKDDIDTSGIESVASKVVKAIRNVAAIAAVVLISVLGIKYMLGSAEEKSGYQKSFIPLIVGAVVVFAATQIATMLFSITA